MRAPRRSPSCQPADSGYRRRQPGHFLESASLHPPQAALRCFPRRPLQKETPSVRMGYSFLECAAATENSLPRPARSASNQEVRQGSCEWRQPFVGCREASSSLVARSKNTTLQVVFFSCAPQRSPSCQPAAGGYRSRQPGHFLESASLHPPQAALRRFPRRPLQKRKTPMRGVFLFWSSTFATQKWSPAGGI